MEHKDIHAGPGLTTKTEYQTQEVQSDKKIFAREKIPFTAHNFSLILLKVL